MLMGTTLGSKAMYTCNIGFMLEGDMTRICQSNGQWSGEAPTCECEYAGSHILSACWLKSQKKCYVGLMLMINGMEVGYT